METDSKSERDLREILSSCREVVNLGRGVANLDSGVEEGDEEAEAVVGDDLGEREMGSGKEEEKGGDGGVGSNLRVGEEGPQILVGEGGKQTNLGRRGMSTRSHHETERAHVILAVLASAGLTHNFLTTQGFKVTRTKFFHLRSFFQGGGSLTEMIGFKKRGRKSALITHPETIQDFDSYLALESNSQKSTVRKLKRVDDVQELIQPLYILSATSGVQKPVSRGGGVSEPGKLSASTLRKYKSPRFRPVIAQSMVCSDCNQRTNSLAVLNAALSTEQNVFMSRSEPCSLTVAIGTVESVKQLCEERKIDMRKVFHDKFSKINP